MSKQIRFIRGHRCRLNSDQNVVAGIYNASEFPKAYVEYVLENNIAIPVLVAGASESNITEIGENIEREALLNRYEEIYGRPAPGNIGDDTLRDKVENPPDDTPDIHG